MKRFAVVLVLSLALGFAGLYLVVGGQLFRADTYQAQNPGVLILGLCVVFFIVRWSAPPAKITFLCREQGIPMPYRSAFLVHLISVLGDALTPSHSGGAPAVAAALGRLGVPLGRGLGVAVQLLILDLIYYSWSLPLGLGYLIYSDALDLPRGFGTAALVATLLSVIGATLLSSYPWVAARLIRASAKLPLLRRFDRRLDNAARDYYSSARAFLRMSATSWLALQLVTAAGWLGNYALLWGLMSLYGIEIGPVVTLALLNVINLISNFVPTPGGSGFIEAAVGLISPSLAGGGAVAAPILLWRVSSFYLIFFLGPLAGWLLYLSRPVMKTRVDGSEDRRRGEEERP